jgi:hypothetical protein
MGQRARGVVGVGDGVPGRSSPRARSRRACLLGCVLPEPQAFFRVAAVGVVVALVVPGAGVAGAASLDARAARTENLSERGSLHLTSKHGFTLNEQGSVSGTIRGTIYIHLNLSSPTRVTAEVNIYPSGGSLSGSGSASYHVVGSYASFSGSLSIGRGTGTYAHARASGLHFTGTVQRHGDAVAVQLSGPLSY